MSDERLEGELRALFEEDAPATAPASLRQHAAELGRRAPAATGGRRPLSLVAVLGSIAVVAAVVTIALLTLPRQGPVPGSPAPVAPSPTVGATNERSASPASSPSPTPIPITAPTWSFRLASPGTLTPVLGADGSTYVATSPGGKTGQGKVYALDAAGRVKAGWPFAPAGIAAFATPAVATDGTVYALGWAWGRTAPQAAGTNAATLWALDPHGRVKPGWPQPVDGSPFMGDGGGLVVRPAGGVIYTEGLAAGGSSTYRAVALDANGRSVPGWPVSLPGGPLCYGGDPCEIGRVGTNGVWYALVQLGQGPGSEIVALRPDGTPAAGWPVQVAGGEGLLLGADGTVYAWGFDTNGVRPPSGVPKIVRTRFLEIDPDGRLRPGWPVTLDGPVSIPALGRDGTLYATTGGEVGQVQRIVALSSDGIERAGWPYTLPSDLTVYPYSPAEGLPARTTGPSVGPDGMVYVPVYRTGQLGSAAQALLAIAPSGTVAAGWPVWLPAGARFGNVGEFATGGGGQLVQPAFGSDGTIYVPVDQPTTTAGVVMAVDSSGREPSGWPLAAPAGSHGPSHVIAVRLVPQLGLVLTTLTDFGNSAIVSRVPIP